MNTAKDLQARRAQLVADRAECERVGLTTAGVDMAIFNVDRQLQALLGDEDDGESGDAPFPWLDVLLGLGSAALLVGAAWILWGPQ